MTPEGYDSDIITPIVTHDEETPRDRYKTYLFDPLRLYFRSTKMPKESLDIAKPEIENAVLHLRNIVVSAEMGLDPEGLRPEPNSQAIVMAGLITRIFKKGNEERALSWMKDWIKDIPKGETTYAAYYMTRRFIRFVTVGKKKYLDFIQAQKGSDIKVPREGVEPS